MPTIPTEYNHIVLNDRAIPVIENTTMKVIELVMAKQAYGWTPEEIQINHRYLSMSQIHAALAYYWEHRTELDAAITADYQYADAMRRASGDSPFVSRLKAQGLLQRT
jgi:uncharacterized protein (DUF433 family)